MTTHAFRLALAALLLKKASACTIVAVGKDASASGHPIVSHTDDSGPDTTDIRFVRVPRKQWPEGSMRPLHHWVDGYPRVVSAERSPEYAPVSGQQESVPIGHIPQVPETFAYWDMDYGVQNEMGVSIGESTCTSRTVGWPANPDMPYGYNHAGIEELSKIALERCATARCAVETMGDIAVEQGFYSADSGDPAEPDFADSAEALVVADAALGELWIFNVMTGKGNASAIWAAQRVPPSHVVAVGNSFTIRKMKLDDSDNFLYSPGVTKLAEEMGWWSPAEDAPGVFDFFGAYGYTPVEGMMKNTLAFYSGRRMWRIFSLLSPAEGAKLDPNKGNLPNTMKPYPGSVPAPKGSITAQMVMNVLRDHYEGTAYDLTAGMAAGPFGSPNRGPLPVLQNGQWERAISMHRSSWSYVLEARPAGVSLTWLGLDAPHGTAYLPFYAAATRSAPETFHSHEGYMSKFSTKVAWWAFNLADQYSDLNFRLINADVRAKSRVVEAEGLQRVSECEAAASAAGLEAAAEALTQCSNEFAEAKVAEWWAYAFSLIAKYGRYTVTHNESENGEELQRYPSWWLQSREVGYATWEPHGPFHGVLLPSNATSLLVGSAYAASTSVWLVSLVVVLAVGFVTYGAGMYRALRGRNAEASGYVYMAA